MVTNKVEESPGELGFLRGGGEMGERMRAHDWSDSPLGPPDGWPQSLRSVVALMLGSHYPMFVAWGPQLAFLYNDGYAPIFGAKHPRMLGVPFKQAWSEIWDDILPLIERALAGEATYHENLHLVMERNGYPEDTWYSFSYSPVRDESGAVARMFCACTETTQTVLGERRLRESEERLQFALAAGGAVGIWDWDIQNDLVHADARFAELYSVDPARAAAGAPIAEFVAGIHPDDREAAGAAIEAAIETGAPFVTEYRLLQHDESVRWVLARGQCHLDAAGKPSRFPGVVLDITERKRTEALRAAQNRVLELAIEECSLEGALEALVRTVEGQSSSTIIGSVLLLDEDGRHLRHGAGPGLPDAYNQAIDGIEIGPGVGSCGTAAHSKVPVYATDIATDPLWDDFRDLALSHGLGACWSTPILSGSGEVLGTFAMYHPEPREPVPEDLELVDFVTRSASLIIERKRAEAALRESEARLRDKAAEFEALAENVSQLAWMADPDGSIFWYNRRWYDYTGTDLQSMQDWGWREAHHPGHVDAVIAEVREKWAAGEPWEGTYLIRSADGEYRWFLTRAEPIRNEAGELVRWFGTNTDVTAQRAAEEALRELNDTLEARVEERSAALEAAQEALRQSQKLEAMGQLTGGVAHDFNNLLSPIIGSLDLLQRRGNANEREKRLIGGALQSAERAKTLVQRLLAFARRQPLQSGPVDIAALVEGMAELVESTSGPQIRLVVDTEDDLPAATADQNQLEMAILNLSVNARDAMPDGGTLRITAKCETLGSEHPARLEPGDYIRLSIADTGVGMDEATVKRAIEPFFSTKGVGRGTGLGLSMAHGLASQLGGALSLSSKPGLGTNIDIWLPVSGEAAPVPEPAREVPATNISAGCALLVDDEELVRASTADMLEELGYSVVEAASAEAALDHVAGGLDFDVVITDHLMPGMTGTELAYVIRGQKPGTPVLLVSGYAEQDGLDPALPRLTKPFRQLDLAASLADLTGH